VVTRGRRTGRPAGASAVATRRRILDAALKLFSGWGYESTRVKDIALKAGVNGALVHHYFGDKDDLYQAVLSDALRPLKEAGQRILVRGLPADLLLATWIEVMSTFFTQHRDVLWLVTRECLGSAGQMKRIVLEALGPLFQETVAALKQSQARSGSPEVDPTYLVVNTLGMVAVWHTHGELIDQVLGEDTSSERSRRKQREEIAALVLRGALPR
jgi:TetR/AcrR family transcriptional regulator